MIRIADIITVTGKNRQTGRNKIQSKHFDFVICRKDDLSIIGAIELNDSSHKNKKRKDRDDLITEICVEAGIPLLFIEAKRSYKPDEVKLNIKESFNI